MSLAGSVSDFCGDADKFRRMVKENRGKVSYVPEDSKRKVKDVLFEWEGLQVPLKGTAVQLWGLVISWWWFVGWAIWATLRTFGGQPFTVWLVDLVFIFQSRRNGCSGREQRSPWLSHEAYYSGRFSFGNPGTKLAVFCEVVIYGVEREHFTCSHH